MSVPSAIQPRGIARFELERHEGPYESWGFSSYLLENGRFTGRRLPGFNLLAQYEVEDGYFFVTDYDCPFEEATELLLVSRDLQILSRRWFGVAYGSFLFESCSWRSAREAVVRISGHDYELTIRSFSVPFLWPRLRVRSLTASRAS